MRLKEYMMKGIIIQIVLLELSMSVKAQSKNTIYGKWNSESKASVILIEQVGNYVIGRIVWLKEPNDKKGNPQKDIHNPAPALRNQNVLGLQILTDLKQDGDSWYGFIYDPRTGNSYDCILTIENDNLKVRGYLGVSLFGKTTIWDKAH